MADRVEERGQTLPLLVVVVVVAAIFVSGIAKLGVNAVNRAEAQTAADAAALAGAVEGPEAAEEMAAANGGRLVAFEQRDDGVVVTVAVGRASAEARAVAAAGDCTGKPRPWHPVGRGCNQPATFRGGVGGA